MVIWSCGRKVPQSMSKESSKVPGLHKRCHCRRRRSLGDSAGNASRFQTQLNGSIAQDTGVLIENADAGACNRVVVPPGRRTTRQR
jgi:hypothetical protein